MALYPCLWVCVCSHSGTGVTGTGSHVMIPSRKAQEVGGADTLEEHRWQTRTPYRPGRLVTLFPSCHQLLRGLSSGADEA